MFFFQSNFNIVFPHMLKRQKFNILVRPFYQQGRKSCKSKTNSTVKFTQKN